MNKKEEARDIAQYLIGFADSIQNDKIAKASALIMKLERHMCVQGFVGCDGGNNCSSDHK